MRRHASTAPPLQRTATAVSSTLSAIGSSLWVDSRASEQRRAIHMPPGGFDDALPPSFGRQNGKGDLSNVNLRAGQEMARQVKRSRRKLRTPPAEVASARSPTLSQVRRELFDLIRHTRAARGESPSRDRALAGIHVAETATATLKEERHTLPADIAADVLHEENEDRNGFSHRARVDAMTSEAAAASCASVSDPQAAVSTPPATALTALFHSNEGDGWTSHEEAVERLYAVKPKSTVFGSDLDRLERDMMREYHQRGKELPPRDRVYAEFGAGRRGHRMQWEPSSSFDCLRPADFHTNTQSEQGLGSDANRNLAPYHLYAETYRTQQEERRRALGGLGTSKGSNLCRDRKGESAAALEEEKIDLPATANPHFPVEEGDYGAAEANRIGWDGEAQLATSDTSNEIVIDARTDYRRRVCTVPPPAADDANRIVYDAYHQRPADRRLVEVRGADYWGVPEHRRRVDERSAHRAEAFAREVLVEGAVDTSEAEHSTSAVRKETLLYFQAHPMNEMIQEPFVRIRQFMPPGGGARIAFNPHEPLTVPADCEDGEKSVLESVNMDVDIPIQEARRMARELGLDLIRVGALYSQKTDRRIIALCLVGDHREHLRDMIKFKIQKLGVQPPPTKQCIEVPFKGGTHPHAIRFKCVGVAKHLLHRHAVRINLTKFGTPREAFPVLQSIFDELKRQCLQLKAYHTAGQIRWNYNEIYCYLYPSTGRSPKTTVTHPTPQEVLAARDDCIFETEKAVYFDDLQDMVTQKERLQYLLKLQNGTAWADKDEGMSLQRQRAIKVMLGYIPKGNKDIYAARGDVNVPEPFRASHATSVDRWSYPSESNLEQASRGAAALGKRAGMPISEMHDRGETPENPTQLDRFYYTAQGPALEMGEFKEALGLKNNRTKRPPTGAGFATLGTKEADRDASTRGFATK